MTKPRQTPDVVEHWLKSRKNAIIDSLNLRPIEHALYKGKPLSCQRGQATAYFLIDANNQRWILKKFHAACNLDRLYLEHIGDLLPKDPAFICGTHRKVLSPGSLIKGPSSYFSNEFDNWLANTILMPKVNGSDWSSVADDIRDRKITLDTAHRVGICKSLTQVVHILESCGCCHRDLSCGNVFIDLSNMTVNLIDFDSLFHANLLMPPVTTCGTAGYTAPYIWNNGGLDPAISWCPCADRFALSMLNTEFLILDTHFRVTGEGGLFDQDELRQRKGKGISTILGHLQTHFPQTVSLLEQTLKSNDFHQCPSPQNWISCLDSLGGFAPPKLTAVPPILPDYFAKLLLRRRPAAPLQPVPQLPVQPTFCVPHMTIVSLPQNPWTHYKG